MDTEVEMKAVNIDLHNVSHLSMTVHSYMIVCIVQIGPEIPVTLYNAFFEKNCRTYSQLVLYCNVCLQDSAATQITTVSYQCPQLLAKILWHL